MPIYRNKLANAFVPAPFVLTDIAGLSPLTIQAGSSNYSFLATLSVSGLTIPTLSPGWGLVFKIMQGNTVLGSYWMGDTNGGFRPSFSMTAVGDASATGITEDISAKWMAFGVTAFLKEAASFSIIYDDRLN